MPLRAEITSQVGTVFEAVILGLIAGWKLTQEFYLAFTEQEWGRFLGPHGFTVGLILAVVVLWGNGVADRLAQRRRDEKAEQRRDERHEAQLAETRANAQKLMDLQAESIKAKLAMAGAMHGLRAELQQRPCCIGKDLHSPETDT